MTPTDLTSVVAPERPEILSDLAYKVEDEGPPPRASHLSEYLYFGNLATSVDKPIYSLTLPGDTLYATQEPISILHY